jgi:hypothetical protein
MHEMTGLFLGAGASFEAGMPLVWDLTAELRKWLTPEKLRSFNESWLRQGGGHPAEAIDGLMAALSRADIHYESILGYLETQFKRRSPLSRDYHDLYTWLIEMVYHLLYYRHVKNIQSIRHHLKFFSGLLSLVEQNTPLWVFSLNHDLIVECLAAAYGIPLNGGFSEDVVSLPRRNSDNAITGNLVAAVLSGNVLEKSSMPFFRHGVRGINLLKIHGALDVFTFRDGKDLLKILPLDNTVEGVLESLRATNEELFYREPTGSGKNVKATNEIAYADETGEMQFLRRSLLSGAYKFDPNHDQVLPKQLLQHFRANLNHLKKLVCIGYGFGDSHINKVIREWLEFSSERSLVIVGPGAACVPPALLHLALQIDVIPKTATEYLDSCAGIVRSRRELAEKGLAACIRTSGETAKAEFEAFIGETKRRKMTSLAAWISTFSVKDGDLDIEAIGVPLDELVKAAEEKVSSTPEQLIEEFLEIHKQHGAEKK